MYAVVRMERGVESLMFGRRHLHKVADAVIEARTTTTVQLLPPGKRKWGHISMPWDTITFRMVGEDIPFQEFALTMSRLQELLQALSHEVGPSRTAVRWGIHDLHASSAEVTLAGTNPDESLVEQVVAAFVRVGHALAESQALPFSKSVRDKAEALTSMLNGNVHALAFETDEDAAYVSTLTQLPLARKLYALGELRGTVEMVTKRRRRKFVLYDSIFNRAVDCYFMSGLEDTVRTIWGRRVSVIGRITRDAVDGHPLEMQHIREIRLLEEPKEFDFNQAFGIVNLGKEAPETLVRRLRDAE